MWKVSIERKKDNLLGSAKKRLKTKTQIQSALVMVTTRSSKPATPKVTEKEKKGEKDTTMEVEKTAEQKAEEKMTLVIHDLKAQLKEIERAVHNKEPRVISKVFDDCVIIIQNQSRYSANCRAPGAR